MLNPPLWGVYVNHGCGDHFHPIPTSCADDCSSATASQSLPDAPGTFPILFKRGFLGHGVRETSGAACETISIRYGCYGRHISTYCGILRNMQVGFEPKTHRQILQGLENRRP